MAQRSGSSLYYLHGDQLGSVSLTTDAKGRLLSSQEYKPWGEVRSGGVAETKLNYTGQKLDGTGLLYYNARYYDPVLARFTSADTVVPNKKNPQILNRYSYVDNAPLSNIDPTGHCRTYSGDSRPDTDPECEYVSQNIQNAMNLPASDTLTDDQLRGAHNDTTGTPNLDENLKLAVNNPGRPDQNYPARFEEVDKAMYDMENRLIYLLGAPQSGEKVSQMIQKLEHDLAYDAYIVIFGSKPLGDMGSIEDKNTPLGWAYNYIVLPALQLSGPGSDAGWTAEYGYNPYSRILRFTHMKLDPYWAVTIWNHYQEGWGKPINGKNACIASDCR